MLKPKYQLSPDLPPRAISPSVVPKPFEKFSWKLCPPARFSIAKLPLTFEGRVDGTLVWPPRGDKGFGYDAMFLPLKAKETFGEMEPDAKHAVSHRADAFRKLVAAVF